MHTHCPFCGSTVSDIARFCGQCGKKLFDGRAPVRTVPLPQRRPVPLPQRRPMPLPQRRPMHHRPIQHVADTPGAPAWHPSAVWQNALAWRHAASPEDALSAKLFVGALVLMVVVACVLLGFILFLLRDATPVKLL